MNVGLLAWNMKMGIFAAYNKRKNFMPLIEMTVCNTKTGTPSPAERPHIFIALICRSPEVVEKANPSPCWTKKVRYMHT